MTITNLVANYCFPRNWPDSHHQGEIRKDERLRLTFGIHPRIVDLESPRDVWKWLSDLEVVLSAKQVVGVGECGLDTSSPWHTLYRQEETFRAQLEISRTTNLPVVIHCRGDEQLQN